MYLSSKVRSPTYNVILSLYSRNELVAFQRSLHIRRRGGELFDPIRRLAFAVAHRLTGAGCGNDGGGRAKDKMTGRMIGMRLRVDEEAHRHRGELLDGVHNCA